MAHHRGRGGRQNLVTPFVHAVGMNEQLQLELPVVLPPIDESVPERFRMTDEERLTVYREVARIRAEIAARKRAA